MQTCLRVHKRALFQAEKSLYHAVDRAVPTSFIGSQLKSVPRSRYGFSTLVSAAELQFGQPVHETHPHILDPGQLTSGISAAEYDQRRRNLASKLPPRSVAILPAAETKFRSGSVFYEFHQECNFFYLTGFNEPDALAVIEKGASQDGGDHTFHLFVRPKDPKAELWEGSRSGLAAATDVFNADATGDISQLSKHLRPLLASASQVYTDVRVGPGASSSMLSRLLPSSSARSSPPQDELPKLLSSHKPKQLAPLVHALRMYKSEAELAVMRRAGRLSALSFNQAMRRVWPSEKELADFLEYHFRRMGCDASAYVPVVAGGPNALTIHYVRNDDRLRSDELALVDAGGEIGHYVTDITRTFPIGQRFSPAQRDLYEAVLAVQRTCVALCHADAGLSLDKLHEVTERELRRALVELGFDLGGGSMEILFPHHLGHYVGLDVHDCPGASRREPLRERQCVTIEPGIYVPDDERWPQHFRGIGIRIEDSVAVGKTTPLVLTSEAAKSVDDIQELRAEQIELDAAENLR